VEFPRLEELRAKFSRDQFDVLAIDDSNRKEKTLKMVEDTEVTFPVLLDSESVGRKLYKIRGTPTTYVINQDGVIVFRHLGYTPQMDEMMEIEIRSLVGGPA
jgi:peroxiredoxin